MRTITLLTALLIGLFLLAGVVDKVWHWDAFVVALSRNPLIPAAWPGAVAGGILTVETFVAVLLIVPGARRSGLMCAMLLFAIFSGVVAFLLWFAPTSSCGCSFLAGFDTPTLRHLLLNVLVTALCAHLVRYAHRVSPSSNGTRAPGVTAILPSPISDQRSAP